MMSKAGRREWSVPETSCKPGKVDFSEVTSQRASPCTLRNYWDRQSVDLYRNHTRSKRSQQRCSPFLPSQARTLSSSRPARIPKAFA